MDTDTKRSFSMSSTQSEIHGPVLALSVSAKSSHSKKISVQFSLIPYHCPTMSLLTALGRLSTKEPQFDQATFLGQLTSIIPVAPPSSSEKSKPLKVWKSKISEWCALDETFLEELLDATKTATVHIFQAKFVDWVAQKHASLRNWSSEHTVKFKRSKNDGTCASLGHLPKTEMSNRSIELLVNRCFSNHTSFWPRAVVEYLICTGGVGRAMTPEANLINVLIVKEDLDLIELCFENVVDMEERDYVSVLKFLATTDEDSAVPSLCMKWWNSKLDRKSKSERDITPYTISRKTADIIKESKEPLDQSKFGISLNAGQITLIGYCFSAPRVDQMIIRELRSLSISQLHTIFQWLRSILAPVFDIDLDTRNPNEKFPLWWLWYDQPQEAKYKELLDMEYKKWITVIIVLADF